MATHLSILAWKIPLTEEPGRPLGRKELDTTEVTEHIHADDTTLMGESKEELKSLLTKSRVKKLA